MQRGLQLTEKWFLQISLRQTLNLKKTTFVCCKELVKDLQHFLIQIMYIYERVYLGLPLDMYISYPTIEPHYRTPLYDRDLRDVAFIDPSRFKIKALCLPSCFDPGRRQFLGGQLHTYACTQHLGGLICM